MSLDIGKYLTEIRAAGSKLPIFNRMSLMLQDMQDAINQTATAVGVDANGHVSQPDAPSAINVKAASGIAHVTIVDHSQRSRAHNYFVEADTDPSFPQPHVFHLGASRGTFVPLPAKNDNGDAQNWFFRTYSMALGSSQRSEHQVFGGSATPTPVSVGGTTQLTPLPSTGSGTASTTGQQGGSGFGTAQYSKQT